MAEDIRAVYDTDNYYYFTKDLMPEEITKKEVLFIKEILDLPFSSSLLDLPCGYGRHTNRLANYYEEVVGIDSCEVYLKLAKEEACHMGVSPVYHQADMRFIDYTSSFDAIIMLFTSFGIFSHTDNLRVLEKMSSALKTGGKFLIELMNPRVWKENPKKCYIFEKENNFMLDRLSYNGQNNQLTSLRTYLRNGQRAEGKLLYELFSLEQFEIVLKSYNLEVLSIFSDTFGGMFMENSSKMVILGKKHG